MSKRTHCNRGHVVTSENTYTNKAGIRLCRICSRERCVRWYRKRTHALLATRKRRDKARLHQPSRVLDRRKRTLARAGWTIEMFDQTMVEQGNVCALCRKPFTDKDPVCADHKHGYTPEPRGILHITCNVGIGMFRDNPENMRAAADYAEAWA
jgi:hypothetical protein